MAEFLTTNGTSYHIENIIIGAKSKLVLVSPYLQISKTFFERLKDASNKNVAIKIIYGKDELKPNEKNSLAELKNVELFYFQNLHAKCYLNESKMVITSMNMYEFSEKTNREMGVLIDRNIDKELFDKAIAETFSILQSAEPILLKRAERQTTIPFKTVPNGQSRPSYQKQLRGYCIRCETRIEYNPEKPYCADCFAIWVQFENPDYMENVCHRCGEYDETSMNKPQDRNCFSLWKKELKHST
ncbi:phospholipase D family protein [Parasediminibacterium sp. JCM 36343]|uniref:phospholipase D family protein n=1 Tax=Parasediminibacterium sp. JCM 36343 TaxID=3374279 RepID=UPI00397C8E62